MIEGLSRKDEELIMNLITGLMSCAAAERKTLLKATLSVVTDSRLQLFDDTGELTPYGLFIGALREMILMFKGA